MGPGEGFWAESRGFAGAAFASAGSEQLLQVDGWDGLPPVAERAELGHDEGFVLLFAQQREHVLHQLAQPAVTVERQGWANRKLCKVSCCF